MAGRRTDRARTRAVLVTTTTERPRAGLYYGTADYAERHGMTREAVRRGCRSGALEAIKVGHTWLAWDGDR